MLRIMIMSGPDDGLEITLLSRSDTDSHHDTAHTYSIGRRETCDVCIPFDTSVSRLHAHLVIHPDQSLSLVDEKSRNGTFVGRQRVKDIMALSTGELFRIGNTWLRVQSIEIEGSA